MSIDGSVATYTPSANTNGSDTFTFKVSDGTADSNTSTITVTVTSVNDVPVAADKSVTTAEDTAVTVTMSATDVESDALTYSIVATPDNGSLGTVSGSDVVYTPNTNYNGSDTFTYKVTDANSGVSNVATVTMTVTAVNDLSLIHI